MGRTPMIAPLINPFVPLDQLITYSEACLRVYNRYGQLVYAASGQHITWDGKNKGKPQPAGSYIYNIQFKSDYPALKGILHLLR